jgi:threonine synthase
MSADACLTSKIEGETMLTLSCDRCGHETIADASTWRCPACQGPLTWHGPAQFSHADIESDVPSLWRYRAVLPVLPDQMLTLGESITPLVDATIDDVSLKFKLDYLLPTGSFKDRGAAVLLSFLRAVGVERAIEDSSGNAAAAIAAYAARAGIACTIFAPAHASAGKLVQTQAYGTTVKRITGSRDDVAHAAIVAAAEPGETYASHNWHPFVIEGVKTWALEVWEQLGFRAPDNIIVPVGSGSMLLGAWRAFSQLQAAGEIDQMPRLFAAQATACAPIHAALETGLDAAAPVARRPTVAEGIVITHPVRSRELLAALRASHGGSAAIPEAEITAALRHLANQGLYAEPTSAVAAAAARQLLAAGTIRPGETTVVMLSGNGLKATETIQRLLADAD